MIDTRLLLPVTLLKPLKGFDTCLKENLESCFLQNYSKFEIIFSVATANDPAVPVVQHLLAKYPHVDAKLLIGKKYFYFLVKKSRSFYIILTKKQKE